MPPLPSAPQVLKMVAKFTDDVVSPVVICHLLYSGAAPSVADVEGIAGEWGGQLMNGLKTLYNASMVLAEVDIFDLTSPTSAAGTATIGVAGTDINLASAAQAALLLHKTISRRYRGGHPRTYLPGPALDHQDTVKTWVAGAVTTAQAAWLSAITATAAASPYGATTVLEEVNVSYHNAHAIRPVPVIDIITSVTGEAVMATQRRRLQRAG